MPLLEEIGFAIFKAMLKLKHCFDTSVFTVGKHVVCLHAIVGGKVVGHEGINFEFTVGDAIG